MSSTCYAPLQVCYLRAAKLDADGNALAGASNGYVSDALIEATIGLEIDDGQEIIKRNGCGSIVVNFKDDDHIKNASVELTLCKLDAQLQSVLVGGPLVTDTGDSIGWRLPKSTEAAPFGVALEMWAKAWDGAEQARPVSLGSISSWYHFVLPKVKFQMGSLTLGNDANDIPLTGTGYENTALNIDGPFNDWPPEVATAGGFPSVFGYYLTPSLPTVACTFLTVPAQGS